MKTTSAWLGMVALLAVASGCDSEVVGGGGGAGGSGTTTTGGDGGSSATGTSSGSSGGGASSAESTGTTGPATSTSTGSGGGNTLGECDAESGTSGSSSGGVTECDSTYTCDGGFAEVSCVDDGVTEVCDCSLDGSFVGECVNEESNGCSFPINCCHALLGGEAEPNPGPYGACENDGGSSAQSGGGETACGSTYTCDGGDLWIDCSGVDGQSATCTCRDGQGFLLATCEQASVDCDYASGCCFDLVN